MWHNLLCFICRRLPFDWRTPHGFILAFLYEVITDTVASLTYVPLISFFVGSCWLFIAFVRDITDDLFILYKNVKSRKNNIALTKQFCKIVKIYSNTKELSEVWFNPMPDRSTVLPNDFDATIFFVSGWSRNLSPLISLCFLFSSRGYFLTFALYCWYFRRKSMWV